MGTLIGIDRSTGEKVSFKDQLVRDAVIKIVKKAFGWDVVNNKNGYGIDLVFVNNLLVGIEVERAGNKGDYWKVVGTNKGKFPFETLNMPQRKEKYFKLRSNCVSKKGYPYVHNEPGYEENIFIRTNTDFTQFCLVRSKTIRDPKKCFREFWETYTVTTGEIEEWLCFKREDVETYNLINDEWILDTTYEVH